jgi:hypothetical protein
MSAEPPTWAELYRRLPDDLRRYQLEMEWSHEKLRALDLPLETMALDRLTWQLSLPWWRDNDNYFAVRPLDVLAAPERHAEQFARTRAADLSYPMHITLRDGRWFVLDGVHRLLKAVLIGATHVSVYKLSSDDLEQIAA